MRPSRVIAPLLLAAALLAGCSTGDDAADGADAATGTTTSGSAAPTSSGTPSGCPAGGNGVPAGAQSRPTLDVDGDGTADTVWIADEIDAGGGVQFGITTASGATFTTEFTSASPVSRSVLVADVTGNGELIALADDGRQVQLYAVSSCSFVPVQNAQGEQYAFDLGFTGFGTGVGCSDVDGDGARDLVGLNADGTTITSTAVDLDGPRATNGASSTITDATTAQTDLAHSVTCGDLTMAADGVSVSG